MSVTSSSRRKPVERSALFAVVVVVKLYPVVAGAGIPMFSTGFDPTRFVLADTKALQSGTVILTYVKT